MHRFSPRRIAVIGTLGALLITLLILPQVPEGMAEEDGIQFIAIPYQDVIRFKVLKDEGTAAKGTAKQIGEIESIQVQVFNLTGQKVYDSGVRQGYILDWNRTTDAGKRLAHGVYLYVIKAWDEEGHLIPSKINKMLLLPNEAKLSPAPSLEDSTSEPEVEPEQEEGSENQNLAPQAQVVDADLQVNGSIAANGKDGNTTALKIEAGPSGGERGEFALIGHHPDNDGDMALFSMRSDWADAVFSVKDASTGQWHPAFRYFYLQDRYDFRDNQVDNINQLGVGTSSPNATLEVHGSQDNLLALYDPAEPNSPKFKVEKDGDVYADGSYNCGLDTQDACFNTGTGADVAERINTSEWVEKGNVVEIDPKHPGFYRKTHSPYSTKVAGIISTSPGITLGNNFNSKTDKWEDNRPLLALTGRAPVKVIAENGPIEIGDLLVSSSTPGYAMACGDDRTACVGATVGKALEPLKEGKGLIMAQVILR